MLRRYFLLLIVLIFSLQVQADITACTWNMKWFPSGIKDRRTKKEGERIQQAGQMLKEALQSDNSKPDDQYIIFVQEIRDAVTCSNLVKAISITNLSVTSVSNFNNCWQQTAILSSLPCLEASFETWRANGINTPPRGFSYAVLKDNTNSYILCFSLHLKSNLNPDGSITEEQRNIKKRELSSIQLLNKVKEIQEKLNTNNLKVIIAGDFNTNTDNDLFISEDTLRSLYSSHFKSCFTGMKKEDRVTCPGKGQYPDATFDYILFKGFNAASKPQIIDGSKISDHNIVTLMLF